ncbi:MAG: TOBE domain-containing protein, partial [Promethearchaeota archaeon]
TMNFIDCSCTPNGKLKFGENELELNQKITKKVDFTNLKEILLGIRPEHIEITPTPRENAFEVYVSVIEYLGSQTVVSFEFKGEIPTMAVVSGYYGANMGDRAYVSFSLEKIHIFDKNSEINLVHDVPVQKFEF